MKREAGVTLLELMMVVAIISILAAIAYPSYRNQIMKSNRTEAKAALSGLAQTLQRCYTQTQKFAATTGVQACNTAFPVVTERGLYSISISPALTATTPDQTYTLTATPQGSQASDTRCGDLTLTDANVRGRSGSAPLADCW